MPEAVLTGMRILVVEDEYLLAEDIREELEAAGALVLGPVANLRRALDLIDDTLTIDGAVLDMNLAGEMVFPAADLLIGRGVPLIFTTGYHEATVPPEYAHIVLCGKPLERGEVAATIHDLVHANSS
ncbi:MAG: response regulator [Candidatus Devosia phytovorans]|uniref:Response regulator n=1 Tax=Candidatus Devosia phytovorans TaxID=3121372 RepID=A0AAJ6AZY2_9HYPH|nr:response regulator [Devosia sp.]WEK02948.1 MAG: response regulator [Devosia sp.]